MLLAAGLALSLGLAFASTDVDLADSLPAFHASDEIAAPDAFPVRLTASSNGRYLGFLSQATNLVAGVANGKKQAFRVDRKTKTTTCLTLDATGAPANDSIDDFAMSANGRYVAYITRASNLGTLNNGFSQAIWQDLKTGQRVVCSNLVSAGPFSHGSNLDVLQVAISGNGKLVAFTTAATNLTNLSTNFKVQVYVYTLATNALEPVSLSDSGSLAGEDCGNPVVTFDGRRIAFTTFSQQLDAGAPDTDDVIDVYMRDRSTADTRLISEPIPGGSPYGSSNVPAFSKDGRFLAFASSSTGLVENDSNGIGMDVFVRDLTTGKYVRYENPASTSNGLFYEALTFTADGRYLLASYLAVQPVSNALVRSAQRIDRSKGTDLSLSLAPPSGGQSNDSITEIVLTNQGKRLFFTTHSAAFGPTTDVLTHTLPK